MARWKYWIRFFIAIGLGCSVITMASSGKAVVSTSIYTDKARYTPGEAVRFTMFYESGFAQTFSCVVAAFSPFDGLTETTVQAEIGETVQTASIVWQPPATDFCGYLVRITAFDGNGNEVIFETAVDVSSSWVKFPRYGYLWDYTEDAARRG